jgi:hypothetical protein
MVVENDVMELQTGVRICVCSVRIFESSLHEGGSAVLASQLDLYFDVVHHAVVHLHQWQKRAICSLNALRGCESLDRWRIEVSIARYSR